MSCSKWSYVPEICDGDFCVGECDICPKAESMTDRIADYILDIIGDDCACNFNDIDEWLPYICEFAEECDPHDIRGCWKQYIKHLKDKEDVINGMGST